MYIYGEKNNYGQLGLGDSKNKNMPTIIKYLKEKKRCPLKNYILEICRASAIETNSKIYSWGIDNNSPVIANMQYNFIVNKIICLYGRTIILADNKFYTTGKIKS